jgi:hypothetical protein
MSDLHVHAIRFVFVLATIAIVSAVYNMIRLGPFIGPNAPKGVRSMYAFPIRDRDLTDPVEGRKFRDRLSISIVAFVGLLAVDAVLMATLPNSN